MFWAFSVGNTLIPADSSGIWSRTTNPMFSPYIPSRPWPNSQASHGRSISNGLAAACSQTARMVGKWLVGMFENTVDQSWFDPRQTEPGGRIIHMFHPTKLQDTLLNRQKSKYVKYQLPISRALILILPS